ncbi:MAG: peptidase M2 family protein [Alphaproteobacteria bacterium]|nr:peptidase M2 family protein [Alphaproteobacteria bacterium]
MKLLKRAAVAIAAMCVAACAMQEGPAAPTEPARAAATAEEAEAFVAAAEQELAALGEQEAHTAWVYETYINYDTEWLVQRVAAAGTEARVRLAAGAARFQDVEVSPALRRKLDLLRLALVLPAPQRDGAADELAAVTTRLASAYSTGRIDYQGRQVTLDELETLMGTTRDPALTAEMWTKWHDTAAPMAADYARMVEIANEGARGLGYDNVADYWLSNYDMPPDEMAQEVDRLWGQMQPFYSELHCYVRARLNDRYGDAVVPLDEPIRADLLGNMWAQEWGNIDDIAGLPMRQSVDLTQLLQNAGYDAQRMTETGERFYTSLGLPELPDSFWERSQFVRPRDRDVVCHASAWNLDSRDDVRIKMCIQIDADNFQTIHHELGHNYYQRAYNQQPFLFQNGAHDGFHEAIGDFIALNATPEYLVRIGLLRQNQAPSADADNALLMRQALDKVAFLPFALSLDQWRWQVFRGDIAPENYNAAWWELRRRYQGIRPPTERPAGAFDPGAKYHIPNSVPYLRYFLARVLQFQFYEAACRQAGWEGPLHRCTVYGNTEVGARFNAMMEMGQSRPWPDALEAFTGTRQMDGSSMVNYFRPLMSWLENENRGRQCGWE